MKVNFDTINRVRIADQNNKTLDDFQWWAVSVDKHNDKTNTLTIQKQVSEDDTGAEQALPIQNVNGSFDFDPNETKESIITKILYRHMCEVDSCVNEIDFEEVVKDIIEYT